MRTQARDVRGRAGPSTSRSTATTSDATVTFQLGDVSAVMRIVDQATEMARDSAGTNVSRTCRAQILSPLLGG